MGMRLVKKRDKKPGSELSEELKDDPKKIKSVVEWQRLNLLVSKEIVHEAWASPVSGLHRKGTITDAQRAAADEYYRVVREYQRTQAIDLDALPERSQEFQLKRIEKAKERYKEAVSVLGMGKRLIDDMVFELEWPITERQKALVIACLEQLTIIFDTKNKA
jgi:hypothetical protein